MTYTNAAIPTPSVSFTYDRVYARVVTMVDGTGTTSYTYHPADVLGAGQVASVDGPLTDDTIAYTYDELGRVLSRAINGVAASQAYDALGQVTSRTDAVGRQTTYTYDTNGIDLLEVRQVKPGGLDLFVRQPCPPSPAQPIPRGLRRIRRSASRGGGKTPPYTRSLTVRREA